MTPTGALPTGTPDASLVSAGARTDAIGHFAARNTGGQTPADNVAALRGQLESGTLTNLKSSGVGSHSDHSA